MCIYSINKKVLKHDQKCVYPVKNTAIIFHILFHSYVPQRHGINPYSPRLQQKDECTLVKYLVTETPANVVGKLIRHLAPG